MPLSGIAPLAILSTVFSGDWQPRGLMATPNGLVGLEDTVNLEAQGVPEGEQVYFRVLQDCDGDLDPDLSASGACVSPLGVGWSAAGNAFKRAMVDVRLGDLPEVRARVNAVAEQAQAAGQQPPPYALWIMASATPGGVGEVLRLGVGGDVCGLWDSLASLFGGACQPDFVDLWYPHRGFEDWRAGVFQVHRMVPDQEFASSEAIPGTLGATGLAWVDDKHLLVTLAPPVSDQPDQAPVPGLYRVDLDGAALHLLAPAAPGAVYRAPLSLGNKRWAVVQETAGDGLVESALVVLCGERVKNVIPLGHSIHRLMGHADGQVLALSWDEGSAAFLKIDLRDGSIQNLGFDNSLMAALQRAPDGSVSAVDVQDSQSGYGWELVLADAQGRFTRDLRVGQDDMDRDLDDLMPAWRPGHFELVFLSEVREE